MGCVDAWTGMWGFLLLFGLCFFLETITDTYPISAIQSIENQFQIPSRMSGALMASSEIGYLSFVVVLSYFGSRGNRARWIGGGCLLIAVASLIVSLPHFIFSDSVATHDHNQLARDAFQENSHIPSPSLSSIHSSQSALLTPSDAALARATREASEPIGRCDAVVNTLKHKVSQEKCKRDESNMGAYWIVFFGIMLIGVGHSMPWTLGVPLIDDNVKKRSTPLYFAGMFCIRILGPTLGFVVGAACTRLYYNFAPPLGMTPSDPRWIGAWWLGFLVVFAVLLVPSILLFCFPNGDKSLTTSVGLTPDDCIVPRQPYLLLSDNDENGENQEKKDQKLILVDKHQLEEEEGVGILQSLKNFLMSLWVVVRSPVYTGCLIGKIFDAMAMKGSMVFFPKYLESHYGLPQFKANLYLAGMGVVMIPMGLGIGSLLMRKLKLEGRKAAGFLACVTLAGVVFTFANLALGCTSINNQVGQMGVANGFNFTSECNEACKCEYVSVFPVCSAAGTPYSSPCAAGCTNVTVTDSLAFQYNFSDCGCVDEGRVVSRDYCVDDCGPMFIVFCIVFVAGGLVAGTSIIPHILIVLRSVPAQHRSVGLGFSGFAISLLSFMPSPIIYGLIVDSACIQWEERCSEDQLASCNMYDPAQLRIKSSLPPPPRPRGGERVEDVRTPGHPALLRPHLRRLGLVPRQGPQAHGWRRGAGGGCETPTAFQSYPHRPICSRAVTWGPQTGLERSKRDDGGWANGEKSNVVATSEQFNRI